MEKSKFIKFVDERGDYYYNITLPTGEEVKTIPKVLGDYIHKLEQLILNIEE